VFLRELLRKELRMTRSSKIMLVGVVLISLFPLFPDCDEKTAPAKTASEKEKSSILVTFVELGSVGCIPCKMMQPVMEEIKKEYAGKVEVVFYDVWTEEGKPYAEKYSVRLIPTQVFLDADGKEYFRHEGFFPKEELIKVLQQGGVK
jgi:thioredoxin 1